MRGRALRHIVYIRRAVPRVAVPRVLCLSSSSLGASCRVIIEAEMVSLYPKVC